MSDQYYNYNHLRILDIYGAKNIIRQNPQVGFARLFYNQTVCQKSEPNHYPGGSVLSHFSTTYI